MQKNYKVNLAKTPQFAKLKKMNIVLKVFDGEKIIAQWLNPPSLSWEEELVGAGELQFQLPIRDAQLPAIREFLRIKIFTVDDEENPLFTGYLKRIQFNFTEATLTCADEKKLMEKRIIYTDKEFYKKTIAGILEILCAEFNARSGENLIFETDLTETFSKNFTKGANYFSILDELAELADAEWTVRNDKIYFQTTIGADKTGGKNFVEFVSNTFAPSANTISNFVFNRDATKIHTAAIGKDGTNAIEKEIISEKFPRLEILKSFSDGDLIFS